MKSQTSDEKEAKALKEARKVLGATAANLSDEELKSIITEMKFLASSWLDDFERKQFDGKTLAELMDEEDKGK